MGNSIIPVETFDCFVFGATGDLAQTKLLPALFHRYADGQIPESARIIGCARTEFDNDGFKAMVNDALKRHLPAEQCEPDKVAGFLNLVSYIEIDIYIDSHWQKLVGCHNARDDEHVIIFYLSVGPSLFAPIVKSLRKHHLHKTSRIVLEKPLGFDLPSAHELNKLIRSVFTEKYVYRIDHYLGKETVQNLMSLRFANAMFEPLWNSHFIDHVQITAAESVGLQGRGDYYDRSGAMRDMVQNHLLQLLCLCAMEPPPAFDADSVRDEKLKILRSLQPLKGHEALNSTVRGQYLAGQDSPSYLDDVNKEASATESFLAINATINNWRWAGTPFYLRTGKRLRSNMMEIAFIFKPTPHSIFGDLATPIHPNQLIIRLQPTEGIDFEIMTKEPGHGGMRLRPTVLNTSQIVNDNNNHKQDAYQRLLLDVVRGDQTLFMRSDEVEAAWKWIDPIIAAWEQSGIPPETYDAGTEGPAGAIELMAKGRRRWRRVE
jgi:glucose-6-phosphate 1-dehydrogenase